jgi:hypothetical protein
MTDEPDLSMLKPTTAEFLHLHANDWVQSRLLYGSEDPRRYRLRFGQDVTNLIRSTASPRPNPTMAEMNRAYMLMRTLTTAAAYMKGPRNAG